jgi:hypothetical protein
MTRRPNWRLNSSSFCAPVGARRDRDRPVGVQVVDVRKRQERVQRRVDRRRHRVLAERAQRIQRDHLVFVRFAAIARDERLEPVEVQQGEAGSGNRSQVASTALHRHHPARFAGQRIGEIELRAGVAAAEVGDAEVLAEQVRPVAQQLERIAGERGGGALVPEVLQQGRFPGGRFRHR